jgi:hypothetical protein
MKKQPRQKKSRMYYYFWSIMTACVLLGQIYVGTGYRAMAASTLQLTEFFNTLLTTDLKDYK